MFAVMIHIPGVKVIELIEAILVVLFKAVTVTVPEIILPMQPVPGILE
jgi:hypothetical protein